MASLRDKIGYIFITEPGDSLKCRICLDLARDPKQCEDCGKLFCTECIEKNAWKHCPNCREESPTFFKDIRGSRDIKGLEVRCIRKGCKWTGTIGTLDDHMSTCQFALVSCPNKCEEDGELTITRKDLDNHLKTTCPNRAHQCQHCGEKGTYASITEEHDKVCNEKIVPCPNKERGCPISTERGKTKQHVRSVCDYIEVACTYESLGCGVRMLRKNIKKHEQEDDKAHLYLSLRIISELTEQQKTLSDGEALVLKVTGYSGKKASKQTFVSKAFYTSHEGYKMCIEVDIHGRGTGTGTHVSIFTKLLKGCYDDQLHWPFVGTVTYELLNQLADDNHYKRVNSYTVIDGMNVGIVKGKTLFFPHSSLFHHDPATNTQYLLDDTLYFRVSVTVDNHKPWLVCPYKINKDTIRAMKENKTSASITFKLSNFSIWKETGGTYYSDSFYIGPGGHEMGILVFANGHGSGKDAFVSVYATILGMPSSNEYPPGFSGAVTFELLNQTMNNSHSKKKKECKDLKIGILNGYDKFISHSSLFRDPIIGIQYLKNNTLYFRVSVIEHKKSWLL